MSPPGGVGVTVTGLEAVLGRLETIRRRLDDHRGLYERLGEALVGSAARRFAAQRDPDGVPWAPPAPSSPGGVAGRHPVLRRTGALASSLGYRVTEGGLLVGYGVGYAAYHEWGTRRLPRRGLLNAAGGGELGAEDRAMVLELLHDWLERALHE